MEEKKQRKKRGSDEPFYLLMGIGGAAVLKLMGVPSEEAEQYRFRSVVLKEKRLEPDIEGLPVLEGEGKRVLLEFQGYEDNFIRYRLFAKIMMSCALEQYQGKVLGGIIYTEEAFRNASLSISAFDEGADCRLDGCISEVVLTEYTESQLKEIDPKLNSARAVYSSH